MDDRTRRFAHGLWTAFESAITRSLDPEQIDMCRAAFRWNVAGLLATYAPQVASAAGQSQLHELEDAGRELAAALTRKWDSDANPQTEASAARR